MKISLILCSDMHMDIDKANTLFKNYPYHEWCKDYTSCDMVIIMTCAFGSKKAYSMFVIADVLKNAKAGCTVIATGCLAKLNKAELKAIPNLEVKTFEEVSKMLAILPRSTNSHPPCKIPQNTVIISNGCLKKCSYCVYPLLEKKYESKPIEDILTEVSALYKEGNQIIYITGAHETSDYGIDLYGKHSFSILLEKLCTSFPKVKLVIGWFNPDGLNNDIINVIATYKNIISIMVHIQHNNNDILKQMRRAPFETTEGKIRKLHSKRPDIIISTEIIVGFPGETENAFNALVEYLKGSQDIFQDIGVASYEPIIGTYAATLPNLPDYETRQRRMETIQNLFGAKAYPAPPDFEPLLSSYLKACIYFSRH